MGELSRTRWSNSDAETDAHDAAKTAGRIKMNKPAQKLTLDNTDCLSSAA